MSQERNFHEQKKRSRGWGGDHSPPQRQAAYRPVSSESRQKKKRRGGTKSLLTDLTREQLASSGGAFVKKIGGAGISIPVMVAKDETGPQAAASERSLQEEGVTKTRFQYSDRGRGDQGRSELFSAD